MTTYLNLVNSTLAPEASLSGHRAAALPSSSAKDAVQSISVPAGAATIHIALGITGLPEVT
jgi:hypothetical protein